MFSMDDIDIDGLVQNCIIFFLNALEILQSTTKTLHIIWVFSHP